MTEESLDLFENDDVFKSGKTLLVDGDIAVYRPCCIHNDDDDTDRAAIARKIEKAVNLMVQQAGCDDYIFCLTTSVNFRDFLVDDYKDNRSDVERPVNLKWAKRWAMQHLNALVKVGLEADDLLGILATEDTVTWSLDKDIRQIPGKHLDDETRQIITVTKEGTLRDKGKKIYFDGNVGMMYQLLIGDGADYIIGCGKRVKGVYKSGAKKGQERIARVGVGPKKAMEILTRAAINSDDVGKSCLLAVIEEYKKLHGEEWEHHLETQANLLFMIREQHGDVIKRWTYDERDEYFDIKRGVILNDFDPTSTAD